MRHVSIRVTGILGAIVMALLCVACDAPNPTVTYGLSTAPDLSGLTKFRLSKTAIIVDYGKSADGKAVDNGKIVVTAVPQEDDANIYTIGEASSLLVATHLKVTKRDNTDLLLSVGSEVEDRRVQVIQQAASILGAVIGAAALVDTQAPLPQAIDISEKLPVALPDQVTASGKLAGMSYTLVIGPAPKDATPTDKYVASFGKTATSSVLFYAACRDATLTFTDGLFKGKSTTVKISDPKFIQTIAMPAKGVVTFHTSCGVNVSSEKATTSTTLELVDELIKQAKTLLESAKKKS